MTHDDLRAPFALDRTLRLLRSASAATLTVALLASPALAQIDSDEQEPSGITTGEGFEEDEIVVTGIRQSLENAQALKRNSDTFVDAITASDIGALPDRSVSEALQRVPGVNVLRFAGPDDPDHFSVEGSGVIVRGLPFVRSELNSRDIFSANQGGGLGFEDVSPELLGSVQVFKNQTADMIEGGIAGVVDLRTRLPFDSSDRVLAFSVEGTYSDLVEEITPSISGLYADRFETSSGEFGFLINGSWNNLESRAEQNAISSYRPYIAAGNIVGNDFAFNRFDFVSGENGPEFPAEANGRSIVYIPDGASIRRQDFDRERRGLALAGQWENLDRTVLATAQFFRSESDLKWSENVVESTVDGGPNTQIRGTSFEFDSDGIFRRGIITENVGWRGDIGNGNPLPLNGLQQSVNTRGRAEDEVITDYGFNLKFTPQDNLRFNLDAQYVDATNETSDLSTFFATFANLNIDNTTNGIPQIRYIAPDGFDQSYFSDPFNYFWRAKMDHVQDNEADELAFRGDVEYDFSEDGFFKGVRFGARYAQQDATVRYSTFNWGNVTEIWDGRLDGQLDTGERILRLDNPAITNLITTQDFEDYQRGWGQPGLSGVPIYGGELFDYDEWATNINNVLALVGRGAADNFPTLGNREGVIPGTLFLPNEITQTELDTLAFYGRLNFGGEFGNGMSLDGNVGLRYVESEVTTQGNFRSPSFSELVSGDPAAFCDPARLQPGQGLPGLCTQDLANVEAFFGAGFDEDRGFENKYEDWLPSANLKINLTDDLLLRLGASRALSRPSDQQLRADLNLFVATDIPVPGGQNEFQGFGLGSSTGGNPFLEPVRADQFDASVEWYFGDSDNLTLAAFSKTLRDYWVSERVQVDFTQNGVTLPVFTERTINSDENAKLKGFEIGYQQFYDFLPGLLSGLGAQFNYTYIDADGVGNIDETITARFPVDQSTFERVSEHQFNLVGLYERDGIQARLAYNWRDDFLLTRRDVIFPFNSIFQEATGQLDGSIFFDVNEQIKVGLQGVNLLDDITETTQTIAPGGLRAPRAFNRNDRRISFIVRGNF